MRAQRKQRLMNFLENYLASNDEPPTIREIGNFFGWSSSATVFNQLIELENMGLIRRTRKWRGIEIVK